MKAKNIYEIFTKDPIIFQKHTVEIDGVKYKGFQSEPNTPIQFRGLPFGSETSAKNRFKYAELFKASALHNAVAGGGRACKRNGAHIRV